MLIVIGIILIFLFGSTLVLQLWFSKRRKNVVGQMVIMLKEDGTKVFMLELQKDPDQMMLMDYVTFTVQDETSEDFAE